MNEKRLSQRIIAGAVILSFLMTIHMAPPVYAFPAPEISPQNDPSAAFPQELSQLEIPEDFGSVESAYRAGGEKTVILIQDAHAIPDAQRSIQKLIQHFEGRYGIRTVALEGAASVLDTQMFRSFPDQERLAKVFEAYMEAGELAGGPAAAVLSDRDARYYGVEDWGLYEEGIRSFQAAMAAEVAAAERISALKKNLSRWMEFRKNSGIKNMREHHLITIKQVYDRKHNPGRIMHIILKSIIKRHETIC